MARQIFVVVLFAFLLENHGPLRGDESIAKPLVLAHYMPWFTAKPTSSQWGWHWTMNKFDPDKQRDGMREIASHYHPQIGPYDSGDPHVIEYHLLLMKLAGIDGVIVDWYGLQDLHDYATLHRNTQQLVSQCERFDMKFLICYEDQTIPALVKAGRLTEDAAVPHAQDEIRWLAENWFHKKSYVRIDNRPALLSFGHNGLTDQQWKQCLDELETPLSYFSQHKLREVAIGGFDWPVPKIGIKANQKFLHQSRRWEHRIPVAFPRFVDIYAEAGVHPSWGRVEDASGETLKQTLTLALDAKTRIVQIATWNDWGEGTQIEPSHEHGMRDLEIIQQQLGASGMPSDLALPKRVLALRRRNSSPQEIAVIVNSLANGDLTQARKAIEALESSE